MAAEPKYIVKSTPICDEDIQLLLNNMRERGYKLHSISINPDVLRPSEGSVFEYSYALSVFERIDTEQKGERNENS